MCLKTHPIYSHNLKLHLIFRLGAWFLLLKLCNVYHYSFPDTQTYISLHLFFLKIVNSNVLVNKSILCQARHAHPQSQISCALHYIYTVPNKCCLVNGCIRHLCLAGTGYVVARHRPFCCGETGSESPLLIPCSGIWRHGEVLQPAVIVNHGKAAKAGCCGASMPPETRGWAGLWS